ncbi:MAG: FtsW/RodA/SpoVE family cell cycle protein, partial [Enterobacterales bacterium]|nr:FtsW/RodA/SpoVE family cell cycle protein [Enterobacterales bacterium]
MSAPTYTHKARQSLMWRLHIDTPLLIGLLLLLGYGLIILYSAAGENFALIERQFVRIGLAFVVLFVMAQIPPRILAAWTIPLYGIAILLLVGVMFFGVTGKGAQRWLD